MNITSVFLEQASRTPDAIALIDRDDTQVSYGELAESVRKTAAHLQTQGIHRGDRVLIFIPMSIDLYRNVLALFYLGATVVFLDEWVNRKRLALCCELVSCKAMIGTRKALLLTWFLRPLRRLSLRLNTGYSQTSVENPPFSVDPEETALITFTTGSTGVPKAADRSHAFLQAQFEALKTELNPQPGEVAMPILPIVLLINLGAGVTSVIADFPARKPEKIIPAKILDQVTHHKVRRITSSPFVVDKLASHIIKTEIKVNSVQQVFTGGAPVFPAMAQNISKGFPQAQVNIVYGSTEAEPISLAPSDAVISRHLSGNGLYVGEIHDGCELRIIPISSESISARSMAEWEEMALPAGEIGEIVVAGEHVLKRYIDNPQAWKENKIIVAGEVWHRTGDAGFLAKDGHLYLTGRARQMIFRDETWVAPFIWEERLAQLSGVTMGTVLQEGNELVVVLETKSEWKTEQLSTHLTSEEMSSLGRFRIKTFPRIPRDPRHNSKIDYGKLKGMI